MSLRRFAWTMALVWGGVLVFVVLAAVHGAHAGTPSPSPSPSPSLAPLPPNQIISSGDVPPCNVMLGGECL